jgi:hypothetical protein
MISFFFKKKEIILDCFTASDVAYDNAKINYSKNYYPEWWKKEPKIRNVNNFDYTTIKNCPGFVDLYSHGIAIPSWFSMKLHVKLDGSWNWIGSDNNLTTACHPKYQFYGFSEDDLSNIKITSVWKFKTKENINFLLSSPLWNDKNIFTSLHLLPSILNFKYQHGTNINYVIKKPNSEQIINIDPLTPLTFLYPLTEKTVKIKNHLIDANEYSRIGNQKNMLFNESVEDECSSYRRRKKLIDKIEEKTSSCPFKFLKK